MSSLESIPGFSPLTPHLATAGQPSEDQLAAVANAGFDVVINLGLHDDPNYSLKDEAGTVAANGMTYVHIPVQFSSPQLTDLARFSEAMAAAAGKKVLVHCRHNKRVPVFVALDRIRREGWSRDEALAVMEQTWAPEAKWREFIEVALAR